MRVLRGIGWIVCSVLLVLLVPSSAWPATGTPGSSGSWSRSSLACGSPSDAPTSEDTIPTEGGATEPPGSGSPSTECPDETPTTTETGPETGPEPSGGAGAGAGSPEPPTTPSESTSLAEGTCSQESPCVVAMSTDLEAWLGLGMVLLVALSAATFVVTVTNSGE